VKELLIRIGACVQNHQVKMRSYWPTSIFKVLLVAALPIHVLDLQHSHDGSKLLMKV